MTSNSLAQSLSQQLREAVVVLEGGLRRAEQQFNRWAGALDFTGFCLVYAVILVYLLRRLNRKGIYRPQNRELVSWKTWAVRKIKAWIVSLPIIKQYVQRKFQKGMHELEEQMVKELEKERDQHRAKKLPAEGMKRENIESRIQKWAKQEDRKVFCGKLSGMMYAKGEDFCKEVSDFAAKYMYHNPLHLDAFKELSRMEAEVLAMTANLISKNRLFGMITSGGSESLIMSLYAYRENAHNSTPNIVVPQTIHAAVDKGASFFGIEVRKARLNSQFQVDVAHMESLIDRNTIALYASYPNYPHGIIDPIKDIAKIAVKHKVGFHVDACLGGLLAAFLKEEEGGLCIDIQGITSVSLDQHKYGLAPKGVSTVFFTTREMRHHVYFVYSDWIGGIYATPSFVGSRPGFASAGAWYALTHVGKKQYMENARLIAEATVKCAADMRKIPGVEVFGDPKICVVAWNTTEVDVYEVSALLKKNKDWHLSLLHLPKALHVCVTPANYENVRDNLAGDLAWAITELKKSPPKKADDIAAIYGATTAFPSQDMGDEMLKVILKSCFQ